MWYRIGRAIGDAVRSGTRRPTDRQDSRPTTRQGRPGEAPHRPAQRSEPSRTGRQTAYPGDFTGSFTITYQPHEDALPDPGEVVWTWVPYQEDYSQGKDRPVLIVGRDANWLLAVALSSKDHDLDAAQEASEGRYWVEIGRGPWDQSGRQSSVRVNRIVRVDPAGVRRIGARLDERRFRIVADAIKEHEG